MSFIVDDLEGECRRIVREFTKRASERTPTAFIVREMALTLDHMERVRKRQREWGRRFVDNELFLDTEVLNLDKRPSIRGNWLEQLRIRNELHRMRDQAAWRTQRLAVDNESTVQRLQTRLVELLNMYDQLTVD